MKNNTKVADRNKEQLDFAVKFANVVFVLGILFSVLIAVYAIYKIYNPPEPVSPKFYFMCILFGGISATLFALGLRLNNGQKVSLSLLIFIIL
jgi:hypothetical protein